MSVNRYSVGYKDSASGRYAAMLDKQDGGYVSHADFAALEQRLIESERHAAMLQGADGNSPVIPDSWVLVPMKLTAENGAKEALLGEFSETKFINCPECFGDDQCDTCDGSGRIETKVQVSWTNIKAIWAKGIEHFSAAPQQEVKNG
jgi:hypothetical protein